MKSNQGMRQPQLGGVQSQLQLARPNPLCKHREMWRKPGGPKWVCAVCHPPPALPEFADVEWMTVPA
jgi:hypothetical protein